MTLRGMFMPSLFTYILILCLSLFAILVVADAVRVRGYSWLGELFGLVIAIYLLHSATGFPYPRESFSAVPATISVGIMFICVLIGMSSSYFFQLDETFSWQSFLKPFAVSPIVLLPLIGTVQNRTDVESTQLIWALIYLPDKTC